MTTQPPLPDLRILPADRIVLHEETDPHRTARLTELLRRDGILKNPPIVAPLPAEARFVVLDGANRVTALWALGARGIMAQVVDYADVHLDTWNHLVTGMEAETLLATIRALPGLSLAPASLREARNLLTARQILAYLSDPDGNVLVLRGGSGLHDEVRLLGAVVRAYKGVGQIFRLKADTIAAQRGYHADIAALIVFPAFTPADIVALTSEALRLPTGITRHLIPGRALRLNYALDALLCDAPLDAMDAALRAFVQRKVGSHETRFYAESTFLFDE